jgi:hypothetical protein
MMSMEAYLSTVMISTLTGMRRPVVEKSVLVAN